MKITRAILVKFSCDECSKAEELAVRDWLHDGSWPLLPEGENIPDDIREKVWGKLHGRMSIQPERLFSMKKVRRRLLRVAAVLIALIGTATLIYYNYYPNHPNQLTYVAAVNKYRKVVLPDSSVVFLSPGSSIKILQPFDKNKRELTLTGQATFEATHNAAAPFTVISGNVRTTALGTSFKVTSFPDKNKIKVALSYGKVVVKDHSEHEKQSLYLDPGEEVVYNKATRVMHKTRTTSSMFSYKNNILYFKNSGVKEVVEKLEQYYHVNVQYRLPGDVHWQVSGEFYYQPLDVVMKAIAYSCNIHYKIKGDTLMMYAKN